jgi:hypothetical protein
MKKQIARYILLISVVLLSACSSSDDTPNNVNTITFTVNGVNRTINANNITIQSLANGGVQGGPIIVVNGAVDNAFNETLSFSIKEGTTGNNSLEAFGYADVADGVQITYVPTITTGITCGSTTTTNTVNFVTDINDGNTVSGTFSLTIQRCENGTLVSDVISNGEFSVSF